MTSDEQIIQCARDNGYNGEKTFPHRTPNGWCIYYDNDKSRWNYTISVWVVTDDKFKQWQRNYKLEQLVE
jgi:hypothetical protein